MRNGSLPILISYTDKALDLQWSLDRVMEETNQHCYFVQFNNLYSDWNIRIAEHGNEEMAADTRRSHFSKGIVCGRRFEVWIEKSDPKKNRARMELALHV